MKNIIPITLTVLTILLAGFLMVTFFVKKTGDTSSFPPSFTTSHQTLTLFEKSIVPEEKTIYLGYPEESAFQTISTNANYINADNKLLMTIWIEEVEENLFETYKQKAWERYMAPTRASTSEQTIINDREVFLSFREIREKIDDTSKMITMGGGYIFYPEKNTIIVYTMYNPRLYGCEDLQKPETCLFNEQEPLPTREENRGIAEQIISSISL